MPNQFVATYRGSGRFTGTVCPAHHTYEAPWPENQFGAFVGPSCSHPETDGTLWPDADSDPAFWREFYEGEHDQVGHHEPVDGCPGCG